MHYGYKVSDSDERAKERLCTPIFHPIAFALVQFSQLLK